MGKEGIPMIAGACCCAGMAFACALSIMLKYSALLGQASAYDEINGEGAYDQCGEVVADGQQKGDGTGWSMIFKYNMVMYLIFTISYGAALICGPLGMACICCVACSGIPLLACFIMTGIRLFSDAGSACRETEGNYLEAAGDEIALAWSSDGDLLKKLWIAQLATHCPMMCCGVIGIQLSFGGWLMLMGKSDSSGMGAFMRV